MTNLDYMNALNSAVLQTLSLFDKNNAFSIWNKRNLQGLEEPVTSLDMLVHEVIQQKLMSDFPGSCLLSEEGAVVDELGYDLTFVLDPIDGTREFMCGKPYYAISLAASVNREIVAAVVAYPAMGNILRAAKGEGAWNGMASLAISDPDSSKIKLAVSPREVYSGQLSHLRARVSGLELVPIPALTPKVGAVLMRQVDAALYLGLGGVAHLWDYAAIGLIATEAGALFTDLNGDNLMSDLPLVNTKGWLVCSTNIYSLIMSRKYLAGGHNE